MSASQKSGYPHVFHHWFPAQKMTLTTWISCWLSHDVAILSHETSPGGPVSDSRKNPRRSGAAKAEPQNPGAKGVKGIDLDTR